MWNIWPCDVTLKRVFVSSHSLCKTPQQLYEPGKSGIKGLERDTVDNEGRAKHSCV